jgi:hypothetical protein
MNSIDSLRNAMASRSRRGAGRKKPPTQSGMGQQNAPASMQSGQINQRAVRPTELQSQASRKVEPTPSSGQQRLNSLRRRRVARSAAASSRSTAMRGGL